MPGGQDVLQHFCVEVMICKHEGAPSGAGCFKLLDHGRRLQGDDRWVVDGAWEVRCCHNFGAAQCQTDTGNEQKVARNARGRDRGGDAIRRGNLAGEDFYDDSLWIR
eukprot:3936636-Rhodomonas_salina.1